MAELTYHIEHIADTYANILANMDQYQLGISTDGGLSSAGQANDLIYQNASGEHIVVARQYKIANDDTTVTYESNNFGATIFHNYVTLNNDTAEDTDGGRESRISFRGVQSGNEVTTLARIEVSHDGSSDDENGKLTISINDGNDADTPSLDSVILDSNGYVKFGAFATNNLEFIDVPNATTGTVSGDGGYIQVDVADGTTRYIELYSSIDA